MSRGTKNMNINNYTTIKQLSNLVDLDVDCLIILTK